MMQEKMINRPLSVKRRSAAGNGKHRLKHPIRTTNLISAGVVLAILVVWMIVSQLGIVDEKIVPSVRSVWEALVSISVEGYKGSTLLQHLGASFFRLFTAFGLAIVTAVPLGLLSLYDPCRLWRTIPYSCCGWELKMNRKSPFCSWHASRRFLSLAPRQCRKSRPAISTRRQPWGQVTGRCSGKLSCLIRRRTYSQESERPWGTDTARL